ncbi:hypothetical protein ACO1KN_13680, partial [Staphylococcus aureus]
GRLSLKSQPGRGTRIDVELPLAILQDTDPSLLRAPNVSRDLRGQLVLVVDDDDVNRMLATEVLLSAGASVREISNGHDALAFMRENRPAA